MERTHLFLGPAAVFGPLLRELPGEGFELLTHPGRDLIDGLSQGGFELVDVASDRIQLGEAVPDGLFVLLYPGLDRFQDRMLEPPNLPVEGLGELLLVVVDLLIQTRLFPLEGLRLLVDLSEALGKLRRGRLDMLRKLVGPDTELVVRLPNLGGALFLVGFYRTRELQPDSRRLVLDALLQGTEGRVLKGRRVLGYLPYPPLVVRLDPSETLFVGGNRGFHLVELPPAGFDNVRLQLPEALLGLLSDPTVGRFEIVEAFVEASGLPAEGLEGVGELPAPSVGVAHGVIDGTLEGFVVPLGEVGGYLGNADLERLELLLRDLETIADGVDVLALRLHPGEIFLGPLCHLEELVQGGIVVTDTGADPLDLFRPFAQAVLELLDAVENGSSGLLVDLELDAHVPNGRSLLLDEVIEVSHDTLGVPLDLVERPVVPVQLSVHRENDQYYK